MLQLHLICVVLLPDWIGAHGDYNKPVAPLSAFQVKAFMATAFWVPQSAPPGHWRLAPAEKTAPVASGWKYFLTIRDRLNWTPRQRREGGFLSLSIDSKGWEGLHGCNRAARLNRPGDKKKRKTQGIVTNRHQEWTSFRNNFPVSALGDQGWDIACKYIRCVSPFTACVCMDWCVLRGDEAAYIQISWAGGRGGAERGSFFILSHRPCRLETNTGTSASSVFLSLFTAAP